MGHRNSFAQPPFNIELAFISSYHKWEVAVQCLSVLDVLLSFAEFSRCGDGAMCRPEIMMPDKSTEVSSKDREVRQLLLECCSRNSFIFPYYLLDLSTFSLLLKSYSQLFSTQK